MVLAKGEMKQHPPTIAVARTFLAVAQVWDICQLQMHCMGVGTYARVLLCIFVQYHKIGIKMLDLVARQEYLVWLRGLVRE